MKKHLLVLVIIFCIFLHACKNSTNKSNIKNLVTERIQYDVNIKTPDPDLNWYVQNIEGSNREKFVKNIITAAYKGSVKTFDTDGRLLTVNEVKKIENHSDTVLVEGIGAEGADSVIIQTTELDIQRITKIMFLEEWFMDERTLQFEKKVLGICPLYAKYNDDGSFRGYKPLFWVYFDKRYPLKNTNE